MMISTMYFNKSEMGRLQYFIGKHGLRFVGNPSEIDGKIWVRYEGTQQQMHAFEEDLDSYNVFYQKLDDASPEDESNEAYFARKFKEIFG